MALRHHDIAILSARVGVARVGASRVGFCPDDVEGINDEPGEYIWKEGFPPTTLWTLETSVSFCGQRPVAAFTDLPDPSLPNEDVQFTDTSIPVEVITFWLWDFGDGSTSNDQHPVHAYTDVGVYTVTLYVSGPRGSASVTGIHTVESTLDVSFLMDPDPNSVSVDVTTPITFTPTVVPGVAPYTYDWDFGDGTAHSTDEIPIHTYDDPPTGGTYTATLIVTDATLWTAMASITFDIAGT